MTPESARTSEFTELDPHLHLSLESCPTCDQKIPPEKIQEINGKIAAREREKRLAIASQLEKQHVIERTAADAKATAELESERRDSAAREARVREEAQKNAEKLVLAKQAEAEQSRRELVARWQQQLAEAESAQKSAEQMEAKLQTEMNDLRENGIRALESAMADAKEREIEAIEAARRESESAFQTRINEAEASRITAQQREATLTLQLDQLRHAGEAEVAKVKEEAASELLRVRQVVAEEAGTRFRDAMKAQENAVAEANAKASDAEAKLETLTEQHASAVEASLNAQREILEKAKEDELNAERARAFEENQKLATKLADLQRAWENKTAEELGEGAEVHLFEALKKEFPEDDIRRTPRGTEGADILHVVMLSGRKCGTIIYDSKNHNQFRTEHVSKLRADQLAAEAEHAILSTRKFPQGSRQLHLLDGVLLANPARVVLVATIIRQHLLQLHAQRLSDVERESKTAALYDFIVSERCSSLLARIDERADSLLEQQNKEIKWHESNWREQGKAIRAIQKAKADLQNQVNVIIGTSASHAAA